MSEAMPNCARTQGQPGGLAVAGLAADAQVDLLGEELTQAGAHDGVVVDDGNPDHGKAVLVDVNFSARSVDA